MPCIFVISVRFEDGCWWLVISVISNIVSENFLSGHHVTISVRNEDELDLKMILDKVSKVSSSAYNFREKPQGA